MPTSEFSTSKTVFILAVIAGCFAILWPKVFYPMMQAAFTITKPRLSGDQVCCDVISESQVELHLFAAVCQSVIARELATEGGLRKYRHERYPPPGMLERCRKRIAVLCDGLDVSEALLRTAEAGVIARTTTPGGAGGGGAGGAGHPSDSDGSGGGAGQPGLPASAEDRQLLANLSDCLKRLESERLQGEARMRRSRRPAQYAALPSHARQERPPHLGPPVTHPALKERGNPYPAHLPPAQMAAQAASKQAVLMSGIRPPGGGPGPGKTGPTKGSGAMGLLMPIYTVGIVVFFAYTITKVWFRKPEDRTPKIMDFHMDPEYRKYVLSEEYGGRGQPLSYDEFKRQREAEEKKRAAAKLLSEPGRKQVFTAIEGIIAEMDHFRDKLMADQKSVDLEEEPISEDESMCVTQSELDSESIFSPRLAHKQDGEQRHPQPEGEEDEYELDADDAPPSGFECETPEPGELEEEEADLPDDGFINEDGLTNGHHPREEEEEQVAPPFPMDLASHLARLAVMGIDTQADFHERPLAPEDDPDDPEVAMEIANILLQTSVPEDAQLLVSASQCLTHTPTEPLDGWWSADSDDQPVVVTGKMTISLLARGESPSGTGFYRPGSSGRVLTPETPVPGTGERALRHLPHQQQQPPDDEKDLERKRASAERQRQQIEELANNLVQDILQNQVPRVFERQAAASSSVVSLTDAVTSTSTVPSTTTTTATSNGHLATGRPAASGPPSRRRRPSRESISQGSSFEYLSASQDPARPAETLANGHVHHHQAATTSPDADAARGVPELPVTDSGDL